MSAAQTTHEAHTGYNLRRDWSASATMAGFIAVVISYSGPLLVVLEAARAGGLDEQQTASWVWAMFIGSGVCCAIMSWVSRQPVMIAWSIPGAALLITSLGNYEFSDAVGAYVVAAVVSLVLGATGLFGKLLAAVPKPITAVVLAGVLLPFALRVAPAVAENPAPAGALVIGYLVGRRFAPRYAVCLALGLSVLVAWAAGSVTPVDLHLGLTAPVLTWPTFSLDAVVGISVPLVIVTAAGQNAPGLAMMTTAGYPPNDRALLGISAVASAVFAPWGSHALNLAAVTAGIATSPEAHPDHRRRYVAGLSSGLFYILFGLFAGSIVTLFSAIPAGMICALCGVALLNALQSAMFDSMHPGDHQPAVIEAALITLAVTASGIEPFGLVSAFWGILVGVIAYAILRRRPARSPRSVPAR